MPSPTLPAATSLIAAVMTSAALACDGPKDVRNATPEQAREFFAGTSKRTLTFTGFSGAEYEHKEMMLTEAARILDRYDPAGTIVNIGATAEGIGAVYEIAKRKGFVTTGIVSTRARDEKVVLSRCVDVVLFIRDASWGGVLPGSGELSPTSRAMVENSDVMVAIGGGEVTRDEISAARRAGKEVLFIPADMNHRIAREKAQKRGQPAPTDFRGAAAAAF